ncbi:MAG: hypothetical protein ACLQNE_09160 [Thermoguttaceae bacterium]
MDHQGSRSTWPWWVRVALWGLPTRWLTWISVWISVALAAAGIVAGLWHPKYFIGLIFFPGGLWYYLALRWVDRHARW